MGSTIRETRLEEVIGVIEEVLELDKGVITGNTKLSDVNDEGVYVLEIFYKLGVNIQDYTSGETLNIDGKKLLRGVSESLGSYTIRSSHFEDLANYQSTKEFINRLYVQDIVYIANKHYELRGITV